VLDEVRAWQSRPLGAVYSILYLDALQVKAKSQRRVSNKAIHSLPKKRERSWTGVEVAIKAVESSAFVKSENALAESQINVLISSTSSVLS
jgi:hypothetical protein